MFNKLFTSLFILIASTNIFAACYSTGNGDWDDPATWLCNGVSAVPGCGDTIYVQTGHTVTVNNQNNYIGIPGCAPMHIVVAGTLQFTTGNKLDLPCGSSVTILPGGLVQKSTPGDGPVSGPLSWGGPPLPISLLSFTAELQEKSVNIKWITASEHNNDYFTVEKSINLSIWEPIGNIKGAGNSSTILTYTFIDNKPYSGVSYYRLKQTDFDGKSDVSDVVAINNFDIELVNIFPNPANDNINFVLVCKENITCSISMFNAMGQMLENFPLELKKGNNNIHYELSKFSTGVNLIGVSLNGKFVAKKQFLIK